MKLKYFFLPPLFIRFRSGKTGFSLLEIIIAMGLFSILIALFFSLRTGQTQSSTKTLEQTLAFGRAKRILKLLAHEMKSSAKILFPNEVIKSTQWCMLEKKDGSIVQFFFDEQQNFAMKELPLENATQKTLIQMHSPNVKLLQNNFTYSNEYGIGLYLRYAVKIRNEEENLLDVFDTIAIER
jgi:prepilin-type N-terminal cleavage/methylation domain-containing protein